MKSLLTMALFAWTLLPFCARAEDAAPVARQRAYFGVVMQEGNAGQGFVVRAVAPASPAAKAGIRAGDWLVRVGQVPVHNRELLRKAVAKSAPGDRLSVEILRGGQSLTLQVVLESRPSVASHASTPEASLGADRRIRPVSLSDDIRQEIRRHRRLLRRQLASLPEGLEPTQVIEALNAIRNLARDAHANRPGWMSGRAGEISVRFRDAEGSVVLYGANNMISLELYDMVGRLVARYDLNTEAQRRALPAAVLKRLARLY